MFKSNVPLVQVDNERIVKFYYPEIKDLCNLLFTLISGILVFSIAFADKIVDFEHAHIFARSALLIFWVLLLAAYSLGGRSLRVALRAATIANGDVHDCPIDAASAALAKSRNLLSHATLTFRCSLITLALCAMGKFAG